MNCLLGLLDYGPVSTEAGLEVDESVLYVRFSIRGRNLFGSRRKTTLG